MIPEYINYLEEMPIAPTGKIDRKKLETYEMLHEFPVNISNSVKLDKDIKPKYILLTGATGYLGAHILHELFETTDASIYCLIRKSNDKSLLEKLVDTIIHTAADVRHFGAVTHFEKVNIEATKNLIDIAKGKKGVRFNYVSTLGIPEDLALTNQWEDIINKEKFDENLELENVYTNSKLQAEKLVYQAAEEMAVTVYRVGCSNTTNLVFSDESLYCIMYICVPFLTNIDILRFVKMSY